MLPQSSTGPRAPSELNLLQRQDRSRPRSRRADEGFRHRIRGRALRQAPSNSDGTEATADDAVAVVEANKANATYKDMLSFIDEVTAKDASTVSF